MQADQVMQGWQCSIRAGGVAIMLGLGAGCTTAEWGAPAPQPQVNVARQEMLMQQVQRESAMVKSQLAGMEQNHARLVERLDRLETQSRDAGRAREELAALRRDLEQVRGEREGLRQEIVNDLTARINKVMTTSAAARPPPPVKQNGYMHTVVAGQKLADIAKAYKSTPAVIRKANNLKDDKLKAGQQIFIPE
jgi:LysM repeat protein